MPAIRDALLALYPRYRPLLPRGHRYYPTRAGRLYLDVSESPMMLARVLRTYEQKRFEQLGRVLRPGMTFVDVGANKGDFSLFAAALVGSSGRVVVVEPEPGNRGWIDRSVARRALGSRVTVAEVALDSDDGTAELHLGEKSGWHSLATAYHDTGRTITVATRRLDSLLAECTVDRADVVKIDVEGAELRVLHGASLLLDQPGPLLLLVDVHPHLGVDPLAVRELLHGHGLAVTDAEGGEVAPATREVVASRPAQRRPSRSCRRS